MVPRRKVDWVQHVRSQVSRLEDRHAAGAKGREVDGRAANCAATSFPPGPARFFGAGLPAHVCRHQRWRYAEADHFRRLERWREVDGLDGNVGWSWTPDGRSIVVEGMNDSAADLNYRNSNIYVVDVVTANVRRLTAQD